MLVLQILEAKCLYQMCSMIRHAEYFLQEGYQVDQQVTAISSGAGVRRRFCRRSWYLVSISDSILYSPLSLSVHVGWIGLCMTVWPGQSPNE